MSFRFDFTLLSFRFDFIYVDVGTSHQWLTGQSWRGSGNLMWCWSPKLCRAKHHLLYCLSGRTRTFFSGDVCRDCVSVLVLARSLLLLFEYAHQDSHSILWLLYTLDCSAARNHLLCLGSQTLLLLILVNSASLSILGTYGAQGI